MAMRKMLVWYVLVMGLGGLRANAHELGVVRIRLMQQGAAQYFLEAKLPSPQGLEFMIPQLPERCDLLGQPMIRYIQAGTEIRIAFNCSTPLASGDVVKLPWPFQGAFVTAEPRQGVLVGRFFEATAQGTEIPLEILHSSAGGLVAFDVVWRYLRLGTEHILAGWDHLAFVLTLCLTAQGLVLLKLVSAFTIGHSLTLALAALGVVHVPIAPAEACIALSIAFMARGGIVRGNRVHHGVGLVFAFGLLHGLGFAAALSESGIERAEFFMGLFAFNLGVEAGQIIFVVAVSALAILGRYLSYERRWQFVAATAYALGILGVFWTIQRIL
jgi:hypothetical protein